MEREIKFRAWDDGVMVYPSETYGDIYNEYIISLDGEIFRTMEESNGNYCPSSLSAKRVNNVTLMQYTGIKDRNGKEIYEGDVVTCHTKHHKLFKKGTVVFNNGFFAIETVDYASVDSDSLLQTHFWNNENFEVIGNIFESPELIK